uniref:Uncharacterized protein n=1 Tax=Pararge aegeria TaxID=116150 RepID=S4PG83_9NEOP
MHGIMLAIYRLLSLKHLLVVLIGVQLDISILGNPRIGKKASEIYWLILQRRRTRQMIFTSSPYHGKVFLNCLRQMR